MYRQSHEGVSATHCTRSQRPAHDVSLVVFRTHYARTLDRALWPALHETLRSTASGPTTKAMSIKGEMRVKRQGVVRLILSALSRIVCPTLRRLRL